MWGHFFVSSLVGLLLLVVPGMLVLRTFRLRWVSSAVLGAPITVAFAQILFIAYSLVHVPVTPLTFLLPWGIILAAACIVSEIAAFHRFRTASSTSRNGKNTQKSGNSFINKGTKGLQTIEQATDLPGKRFERLWLGAAVLIAILMTLVIDVKNLDGPASYSEHYDTAWHYSIVRNFMEIGDYSTLHSGRIAPTVGSTFYPTGWHALVALTAVVSHVSVMVASNAVNAAVLAIVYPLTFAALARWIFRGKPGLWIASSLIAMFFAPMPWRFLSFGPLFSNFLSYSFVPLLLLEGLALFDAKTTWRSRWHILALFVVTAIGVAVTQPNGIFTTAVVLGIYLLAQVPLYVDACGVTQQVKRRVWTGLVGTLIIVVAACVWYGLYKAPFMQRTVTFNWPNIGGRWGAFADVLFLGFTHKPQLALAFGLLIGVAWMLFHRGNRWLVISYITLCCLYLSAAGTQGRLKQLLTGFWYTDPYRLAASVVFPAVPIAGAGLWVIWRACLRLFDGTIADFSGSAFQASRQWFAAFLVCALGIVNACPQINFDNVTLEQGFDDVIDNIRQDNDYGNNSRRIYTESESAFVDRAKKITGNDVVVNQPFDGSAFAYSVNGMNVLYKSLDGNWMGAPTRDSSLVMHGMTHVTNPKVAAALKRFKARYVLVLGDDNGYGPKPFADRWVQNLAAGIGYGLMDWKSLDDLKKKTTVSGMKLVLKNGNNKLYKLD